MTSLRGPHAGPGLTRICPANAFTVCVLTAAVSLGLVATDAPSGTPTAPAARAAAAELSASDVAARLQSHYDTVKDFSADFTHTYEGGVLRRKTTERGTVVIKKPGKMRWTYTAPEEKLFVSDGRKVYAYVPADRQVTVSDLPSGDEPATPVLFLVGRGNVTRDFAPSYAPAVPGAPADAYAIQLVPKRRVPDYESLTVIVDRNSYALRMLVARDGQGGASTFTFSRLKENVGVPDAKFAFSIPRGVEVVQGS
jgi:outer membrane lipoprotein carrier protein